MKQSVGMCIEINIVDARIMYPYHSMMQWFLGQTCDTTSVSAHTMDFWMDHGYDTCEFVAQFFGRVVDVGINDYDSTDKGAWRRHVVRFGEWISDSAPFARSIVQVGVLSFVAIVVVSFVENEMLACSLNEA